MSAETVALIVMGAFDALLALVGGLAILLWRTQMGSIIDRLVSIDRRMDGAEGRVSGHGEAIVRLDTGSRAAATAFEKLEALVERMDEKIDRLLGRGDRIQ